MTLIGTVTRDPKLIGSGVGRDARTQFSVEVARRLKSGDIATSLFEVRCVGFIAARVVEEVRRGHRVIAFGPLEQVKWGECPTVAMFANEVGFALSQRSDQLPTDDEADS